MAELQLNPTQGSILGLLADGPLSGYEVLARAEAGLSRFWNITRSHVYRELRTLEEAGCLRSAPEGGRDRRPYELTELGRSAFDAWLREPPASEQMRFPLLLKLWFGRHLDTDVRRAFLHERHVEHSDRLRAYEQLVEGVDDPGVQSVIEFGIAYERAILGWLEAQSDGPSKDSPPQ